VKYIK